MPFRSPKPFLNPVSHPGAPPTAISQKQAHSLIKNVLADLK